MERWRSGIRHNFMRFIGLALVAEAFALGQGAVNSLSSNHDRENGLTYTQVFAHHNGKDEHVSGYEFAEGEALNLVAIAGLAGAGIHLIRRRRVQREEQP